MSPRKRSRIITIFGSGHMEENFPEYQRAALLGRVLAENGFTVCTGGYGGIMEAAPRGAKQVGGKTIGVLAQELNPEGNRWLDKVKVEKTWKSRNMKLIQMADAFVIFDGGTGTLTQLFTVWEMINKRIMQKPLIIHGSFLVNYVKRLKRQRLVLFNDCIRYAPSPQAVVDHLEDAFEEAEAEDE